MAGTRPTAVNLFWAIDRMKRAFADGAQAGAVDRRRSPTRLEREARAIHDEDVASCRTMGGFGADVVPDGARVLTHCNAGALATAGYGSALGVIRAAVEQRQARRRLRRRDASVPAGRAADRVGARARRHQHDGDHREHGRSADARRRHRSRRRRRRSHRRQRRHRQQDRHLHRRGARARAQGAVLRRRAAVDDRSRDARRRHDPDRGARSAARSRTSDRRGSRRRARTSATRRSTSRRIATSPASSPRRASSPPPYQESLKRALDAAVPAP